MKRTCTCGHTKTLHEHRRGGSDCAGCDCEGFRRWRRPKSVVRTQLGLGAFAGDLDGEYERLCAEYPAV